MSRRSLSLLAGCAAVLGGLALSDRSLPLHMAGHGLVIAVGAPLIVLGQPVGLLLRSLPRSWARGLAALLRSAPATVLLTPAVAWCMFVGIQLAFHLTPLFTTALHDDPLHGTEHALFLLSALCFWEVALAVEVVPQRLSAPRRALYLWAAMPVADLCGAWLIGEGHAAAGGVMILSMLPLAIAALAIAWSWLLQEEREEVAGEVG